MELGRKIVPCLWFDNEAEEAARFYCGIFPRSHIGAITHYGEAGKEIHGRPVGSVLTVSFDLDGQPFLALNGGPIFKFNEAVSLQVICDSQAEVDFFWERLSAGGGKEAQQCGWLKDRYGLSWQVVPSIMPTLIGDADSTASQRAMEAMMGMKKLDIAKLEAAFNG